MSTVEKSSGSYHDQAPVGECELPLLHDAVRRLDGHRVLADTRLGCQGLARWCVSCKNRVPEKTMRQGARDGPHKPWAIRLVRA